MLRRLVLFVLFAVSIILPIFPVQQAAAEEIEAIVVISELQTGGLNELLAEDGRQEFIELHNQLTEPLDVNGWKVQYFSATRLDVLDPLVLPTRELITLNGLIGGSGYAVLSFEGYLDNADGYFGQGSTSITGLLARSGGHIRIINTDGKIIDLLGWGTAKIPETKATAEIKPSYSAQRKEVEPDTNLLFDTNNNDTDFVLSDTPNPIGGALYEPIAEEEEEPSTADLAPLPPCDNLVITEVLPNPNSTDTDHEFIELHNPSPGLVQLQDCILKTSASTKQYTFLLDLPMQPGEYRTFFDSSTGLTLPNAAGGQVLLIGTTTDYSTQYPANMESDHAWVLIDGQWYDSTLPTPNAKNVLPPLIEELDSPADEELFEPCPVGKYRNLETNRCRNIQIVTAALTACVIGQVRNSDTNRCRNITTLVSSLVPCKTGQERNKETNRCRNVLGASTTQTPCQEGYERNPETNRCRKTASNTASSPSVGSAPKDAQTVPLDFVFMAVASTAILGYGVYEYRRDFANAIVQIKARIAAKSAEK